MTLFQDIKELMCTKELARIKELLTRPYTLTVKVTRRHINCELPKYPTSCAIALALKDALERLIPETFIKTYVAGQKAWVEYGAKTYIIRLPTQVTKFIIKFDKGNKARLKPFEFAISEEDIICV